MQYDFDLFAGHKISNTELKKQLKDTHFVNWAGADLIKSINKLEPARQEINKSARALPKTEEEAIKMYKKPYQDFQTERTALSKHPK